MTPFQHHLIAAGLARMYRGRLIPIIQGGDGRDEPLFPDCPEDLTALTDEALSALADEFKQAALAVASGDEDTLGARPAARIIEEAEAGEAAYERIKAEMSAREEAAKNYDARVAEMATKFGVDAELAAKTDDEEEPEDGGDGDGDDTDGGDGEGDGDESGEGAESEAAAAKQPAAATAGARFRRPLPGQGRHKPTAAMGAREGAELITANGLQNFPAGQSINSQTLARIFSDIAKFNRLVPKQSMVVASASYPFPEDRRLDIRNLGLNVTKINAVTNPGPEALVASGGLCNPLTPIYDIPGVESADRPVRDALTGFQADRGGVQVPGNFTMGDHTEAVGVITSEQDEQGGTFAVKTAMRVECPSFSEVIVDSIYRMIEVGNLTARAYPELLERVDTLVSAEHARLGETVLLDGIKAGSTAVTTTDTANAGGLWEFLGQVAAAATGMRSRHRMRREVAIRALLPSFLIDLLQLDIARGQFDRFQARETIIGYLRQFGIVPSFYIDSPSTGTSQLFAAQTAGALLAFPTATQWALFPEGSWLHLDAGQLDLGIVRDSTLNATNDYQIFAETWEQVAFVGVESLWITSAICPNGTVSAPKDLSAICTW